MRAYFALVLLVLAACQPVTVPAEDALVPAVENLAPTDAVPVVLPESPPVAESDQASAAEQAAVPDAVGTPEPIVPAPAVVAAETSAATTTAADSGPIAEAIAKTKKLDFYYCRMRHDGFPEGIITWRVFDVIKFASQDRVFDARNGTIVPSDKYMAFGFNRKEEIDQFRDGNYTFVDYVWWNQTRGTFQACAIYGGTWYYKKENCIWNLNRTEHVIFSNLSFPDRPILPEELLEQFRGRNATRIFEDRNYRQEFNADFRVDELFFENPDGSETKLSLHAFYRFPLRVEILAKDQQPEITYECEYFSNHPHETAEWHEGFMQE